MPAGEEEGQNPSQAKEEVDTPQGDAAGSTARRVGQGRGLGCEVAVPPIAATELLRPGLLEGVALLVAGPPIAASSHGEAVARAFSRLGAQVAVRVPDAEDESAVDGAVADVLTELGAIDVLAIDGAGLFAHGGVASALRACMDAAWNVTRAVVNLAFLPAPGPVQRILYLAPAADAGEHAGAVRAGLENLARTLSVEWARHGITVVTIASGRDTSAEEVAAVAAYLASPAGAYFSGCLLDMRATAR